MGFRVSHRLPDATSTNALTSRLDELRWSGASVVDLTESNPTRAGIPYPDGLLSALASPDALRYAPSPLGLATARQAVADDCARRGAVVDAADIILTASTSEAYSWLFKMCCNPGERVLVPRPSYPLFEHLAGLEGVNLSHYDLLCHGRWEVDVSGLQEAGPDVRALVMVSPNNPTGSCVSRAELETITSLCRERGWTLIADEVFADYLIDPADAARDVASGSPPCLTVSLGGLSKSVGLPQVKVGWMILGGPDDARAGARSALELIADTFLSVSTPAQVALPDLLRRGAAVRRAIHGRVRTNMSFLSEAATQFAECDVPAIEGGWSAVVRVPATRSEESLVLDLLTHDRILVYPGYFFDFRHEAYLVVSLLVEPDVFRAAMPRVLARATA